MKLEGIEFDVRMDFSSGETLEIARPWQQNLGFSLKYHFCQVLGIADSRADTEELVLLCVSRSVESSQIKTREWEAQSKEETRKITAEFVQKILTIPCDSEEPDSPVDHFTQLKH